MSVPLESIRVHTEPTVYLLGKQVVQPDELARFLSDHGVQWSTDSDVPAEVLTETAGRVCYMSFAKPRPGGNEAYLGHIIEVGHGSVLEHAVWNFVFTGISRSLTHELIRHRAGMGYSQLSQRYVDESVAEYVEPDVIANDPELHRLWLEAIGRCHEAYLALAEKLTAKFADDPDKTARRKNARQAARSVLPNATETKIFVTANSRALRHFMEQRGNRAAEPEIRKLANQLLQIMRKEAPHIFSDYVETKLPDGTFEITTEHRKV
jgi:thymidylate synthase (FAD)